MTEFLRDIKPEELHFIIGLIDLSSRPNLKNTIPDQVIELDDGEMGSIQFDLTKTKRRSYDIIDVEYIDEDGTLVLIELTVDEEGNLFDLDFWKTDFSKLRRYPIIEKVTKSVDQFYCA
ncbi:MAG: hypothetical protein JWQ27_385 [Ferruginibacter sp.]|nr:hypothetical protein [Ferruginibacter sp.]